MEVDDGDDGTSAVFMPLCEDWQMFDANDNLEMSLFRVTLGTICTSPNLKLVGSRSIS